MTGIGTKLIHYLLLARHDFAAASRSSARLAGNRPRRGFIQAVAARGRSQGNRAPFARGSRVVARSRRVEMKIVITCGPSFEPIDDVRRITNFSTGELGILLANRLSRDGHDVTLFKGMA